MAHDTFTPHPQVSASRRCISRIAKTNVVGSCPMSGDGVFHREVFGGLIEGSTSPVARHLFAKWSDISRVRAPAYGDFLPDSNPRVTDNLMVLASTEAGDFVYVSMGEASMRLVGRDLTGKSVSCVDGASSATWKASTGARATSSSRRPASSRPISAKWWTVGALVLPVQPAPASGPTFLLRIPSRSTSGRHVRARAGDDRTNAIICTRRGSTAPATSPIRLDRVRQPRRAQAVRHHERPDQLARSLPFLSAKPIVWSKRPRRARGAAHHPEQAPSTRPTTGCRAGSTGPLIFSITAMGANEGDLVWV